MSSRKSESAEGENGPTFLGARAVAIRVVERVLSDAAYANATIDAEVRRNRLSRADASLVTEIVFGTLRGFFALEATVGSLLTRPAANSEGLDPIVRAALLTGLFQLSAHRSPAFATTSETVTAVRTLRGPKLAGLTNAILRSALRHNKHVDAKWIGRQTLPMWLQSVVQDALAPMQSEALLAARDTPHTALRVQAREDIAKLSAELGEDVADTRIEVETGPLSRSLVLRRAGDLRTRASYQRGAFVVQDLGAQALAEMFSNAVNACNPSPDAPLRLLDACAGHGGKSLALLDAHKNAHVVLCDVHGKKKQSFLEESQRLCIADNRYEYELLDLSVGTGSLAKTFDGVLIDAPCTGIGTLHRRPEIALRLKPDDPARMAELQCSIVHNAKTLVKVGGVFAYAVCSVASAEIEWLADELGAQFSRFAAPAKPSDTLTAERDGVVRIGPWNGEGFSDAYQMMVFQRTR